METLEIPTFMLNATETQFAELRAENFRQGAENELLLRRLDDLNYRLDSTLVSNRALEGRVAELQMTVARLQAAGGIESIVCTLMTLRPQSTKTLLQEIFGCDESVYENICGFLDNECKIDAIKCFRIATSSGLKEAKDAVEALQVWRNTPLPNEL